MGSEIKTLTGLRGAAAIWVMLYHFLNHDPYFLEYVPFIITRGYLGVDVFFVLSGFVMALSYGSYFKDGVNREDYQHFMLKRFARIYPLYIVITVIFSIKYMYNFSGNMPGDYNFDDFVAAIFMIQAWGFGFSNPAGATWSISTEFFAYIIFPFLVFYAVYARLIYVGIVFLISLFFLYLVVSTGNGISGPLDVISSSSILPILRCLAGFCLGLIVYRLSQRDSCRAIFSSPVLLVVLIVGLIVATQLAVHDLIVFALFPLIVLALYYNSVSGRLIFSNKIVYHLGVISYSLYLIHPLFGPIKTRLTLVVEQHIGAIAHPIILVVVIFSCWALACLLYQFIENPGRRLTQSFFLRRNSRFPGSDSVSVSGPKLS